jgi:DNA-binding transcriptional MerR regulator
MRNFSIRHLERFSEIKAHTIRIWEQRFGVFQPYRTKTNLRYYSLHDVKLLLDISLLVKNGHRISTLATTDEVSIATKIKSLTSEKARRDKLINQLIVCMFSHDVEQFEDLLDSCVLSWDVDITVKEVVIPFLERVELLSYNDNSSEAHFAVTAIRRKIMLALERVNPSVRTNKSALLFLAEGEHYDLMLLYLSYVFKKGGINVWYLGTNISRDSLEPVLNLKRPDYLVTYIPQKQKFKLNALAPFLDEHLPETDFIAVGCAKDPATHLYPDKPRYVHYKDLEMMLVS